MPTKSFQKFGTLDFIASVEMYSEDIIEQFKGSKFHNEKLFEKKWRLWKSIGVTFEVSV